MEIGNIGDMFEAATQFDNLYVITAREAAEGLLQTAQMHGIRVTLLQIIDILDAEINSGKLKVRSSQKNPGGGLNLDKTTLHQAYVNDPQWLTSVGLQDPDKYPCQTGQFFKRTLNDGHITAWLRGDIDLIRAALADWYVAHSDHAYPSVGTIVAGLYGVSSEAKANLMKRWEAMPAPKSKETATERKTRLAKRCQELRTAGVRNFTKVVAKEEKISTTRIKQLVRQTKQADASGKGAPTPKGKTVPPRRPPPL